MGGTPRPPPLLGTYTLLDLTPLGRQEDHEQHPMTRIRHQDKYPAYLPTYLPTYLPGLA